ncbi:MAG: hypothetical protein KJN99_04745 [Marinicaulis sp.]|nr:hypothetical protein [Marinicaulis sp.]
MIKSLAAIFAASALALSSANAAAITFKGDWLNAIELGNVAFDCGTLGVDFCTDSAGPGFNYLTGGFTFNAAAFAGGVATQLIQDISPRNSGLGALSEANQNTAQPRSNPLSPFRSHSKKSSGSPILNLIPALTAIAQALAAKAVAASSIFSLMGCSPETLKPLTS